MPRKNPAITRLQNENLELRNVIEAQNKALRIAWDKANDLENQIKKLLDILENVTTMANRIE